MSPPADITKTSIETWCRQYLARVLKLAPHGIDPQASFSSLGLDSAEAVFLVSALEDWTGLELSSDIAMEHPSVADLTRFIASKLGVCR